MSPVWIVLIIMGGVLYFIGYCWCWGRISKDFVHPSVAGSIDYAVRDVVIPSMFASIGWPVLAFWLVCVKKVVTRFWSNSRVSRAKDGEVMTAAMVPMVFLALLGYGIFR